MSIPAFAKAGVCVYIYTHLLLQKRLAVLNRRLALL
jgi:hypothetical protein